jgi:hypothetical protein
MLRGVYGMSTPKFSILGARPMARYDGATAAAQRTVPVTHAALPEEP